LLLALRSPEIELVGVTTVAGNVLVEQGSRNARALLAAAGYRRARVYTGAERPLVGRLTTATFFHGERGLGNLQLPDDPGLAGDCPAAELLVRVADGATPLTVIAIGPLTNLALACRLDPTWAQRLERIVVMGGAVSWPGNVTPVAEANFYSDPDAAAVVLESGATVTLVDLGVTMQAALTAERWAAARARVGVSPPRDVAAAVALLDFYVGLAAALGEEGPALHDPLAVAVACQPDLVRTSRLQVRVECGGSYSRGQSIAWMQGTRERIEDRGDYDDVVGLESVTGPTEVCLDVDAERFVDLFLNRVLGVDG
jgi:purine nucleosidase